jgi:hypothetical protein
MLDASINQAAGLQGLACSPGAQLIAMVSHGDDSAELPLLWQLCSSLVDLGYPVTVLDGTSWESTDNPGLSQLLDHTYRARNDLELHLPWSVIPAACGLREVDYGPEEGSLYRLGSFFGQDDLVLVYADAQALALLLATTHCTPLLVLSESKNSLLTSYTALKRLTQHGHLSPVIANIGAHRQSRGAKRQNHMVMNLLECARNFLGFQGWVFNITAPERAAPEANDVRRLALGLLETAVALRPLPIAGASTGTIGTLSSLRNH